MKKRMISLLIAVVMILGMIPLGTIPAFAEGEASVVTTEAELRAALDTGIRDIKLGADIVVTKQISLESFDTLDLAGYTLKTGEGFDSVDMFSALPGGVTVTITDSSEAQTGKITASYFGDSVFWLSDYTSTVIFENVTIEHTGNLGYATIYSAGASLVFKNCSIGSVYFDSKNGGPIKLFEEVTVGNWKLPAGARLNVDPTAFPGFDSDHHCAKFDEETGFWVVKFRDDLPPVAWSDDNNNGEMDEGELLFRTLYDALNTSGSVKMVDDYDARMEGDIDIDSGEALEVTLDLNGKSILTNADYFFDIYRASLTVTDSSPEKSGRIESTGVGSCLAYLNSTTSSLLIEGGTWQIAGCSIYVSQGNCTITGGVFQSVDSDLVLMEGGSAELLGGSFYHDVTQYLTDGVTATYNEDTLLWEVALQDVLIRSANLSLGNDLSVNYYVQINESTLKELSESFSMQFTMNGKTTVVTDYTEAGGYYVFNFAGIAPQQLTDNISAAFLIGDEVYDVIEEFSVRAHLDRLMDQYSKSELLVQLAIELIGYGAAAQRYKDYNLDRLADADFDAVYSGVLPERSDKSLTESLSPSVYFTSATVWFDTVNRIGVKFSTAENVTLKVNGEEVALDGTTYYTNGIYATDFDKVYTFELYENGALVQTLTYSVNSYVYSMMDQNENGELTEMALLARALYSYGLFAKWVAELPTPEAVEITDWNATAFSNEEGTATYDEKIGWTPTTVSDGTYHDYFTIDLRAGDTVYFELTEASSVIGLIDFDTQQNDCYVDFDPSVNKGGSITVGADGRYTLHTTEGCAVRAWVIYNEEAYGDPFDDSTGDVDGVPDEDYDEIPNGEITDSNERLIESVSFANGTYDSEIGWSSTEFAPDGEPLYGYFSIQLNAGECLYYEFSEAVSFVGLYNWEIENGSFGGEFGGERTVTSGSLDAIVQGVYEFYTENPNVSVRVWFESPVRTDDLTITDNVEIPEEFSELTDADEAQIWQLTPTSASYDAQVGWTPVEAPLEGFDSTTYLFFAPALNEGEEMYLEFSEETPYFIGNPVDENMTFRAAAKTVKITGNGEIFVILTMSNVTMRAYVVGYDFEEITEINAEPAREEEIATYDPELGWSPVLGMQNQYYTFVIELQKGDVVRYLLETPLVEATLYSLEIESEARKIGFNTFLVAESGTYWFSTPDAVNVKAWVARVEPEPSIGGNQDFIPV